MAILTWLKTKWQIQESKYTYGLKLLVYFYPYQSKIQNNPYWEAVILKFTLTWNFGEIEDRAKISTKLHFLGYRTLIKSDRMITPILYHTCSNTKFNTCIYKKVDTKITFFRTKIRNKTVKRACIGISFFFCYFLYFM